jgi:hypothetical protein
MMKPKALGRVMRRQVFELNGALRCSNKAKLGSLATSRNRVSSHANFDTENPLISRDFISVSHDEHRSMMRASEMSHSPNLLVSYFVRRKKKAARRRLPST